MASVDQNNPSDGNEGNLSGIQLVKFVNDKHFGAAFTYFQRLREKNLFCDVILKVDGKEMGVHKLVLVASIPYFDLMFRTEMSEKDKSSIPLSGIDYDIFEQLINYAYTGQIIISQENVQRLLPAACLWQLSDVQKECCEFLKSQLDPTNCFGMRSFADTHSCKELYQLSDEYIKNNFTRVSLNEEFLLLSPKDVEDLISEPTLNVPGEEDVYNALIRWIKHDIKARERFLAPFFAHIRLVLLSSKFLMERVRTEKLIQDNLECKNLCIEAMEYHLSPEYRSLLTNHRTTPRKPFGLKNRIFVVGGAAKNEYFNPESNSWCSFAPTQVTRLQVGVTSLNPLVYAIGGRNGGENLSSGECYDPFKDKWQSIECLGSERSCFGIASLERMIYVAGGIGGAGILNLVERYDPLVDSWSAIAGMRSKRIACRLVAFEKCLYTVGGFDGNSILSSMERIDPREGKWYSMPSMSKARMGLGFGVLNEKLYAAGGCEDYAHEDPPWFYDDQGEPQRLYSNAIAIMDPSCYSDAAEKFDPIAAKWEPIANMNHKRSWHCLASSNGFLYAMGGYDCCSTLNSVEKYDPSTGRWMMANPMLLPRKEFGATALD